MNWIKQLFSKKETTKQCDIHFVSSSLKHTMTLGLMLPVFIKDGTKPNYQILNINYNCSDDRGDLVRVTLEVGTKVDVIEISTQEAVYLGFMNPYGLKDCCRHH